jgi:hypothetical protein
MTYISLHHLFYETKVPSSADDGVEYLVTWGPNMYDQTVREGTREWSCTCGDWIYRRRQSGEYCKHIEQIIATPPEQGGACFWVESETSKPFIPSNVKGMAFAPVMGVNGQLIPALALDAIQITNMVQTTDVDGNKVFIVVLNGDNNSLLSSLRDGSLPQSLIDGLLQQTGLQVESPTPRVFNIQPSDTPMTPDEITEMVTEIEQLLPMNQVRSNALRRIR